MGEILHKDLSYKIQGAIMAVHRKYGPGLPERFFHRFLAEEFALLKLKFTVKPKIKLYSITSGEFMGYVEPDFLVENLVIVEIKAVSFMPKCFETQLYEYLKSSIYELGYLINFGTSRLDMRRRIFTNDRKSFYIKRQNQINL